MNKQLDKSLYLSIGQFAKASGISRKNLIYYDSIGLFSPEITLDNGYRYYYYRQLYTVNMILTLREIGMPLKEIKAFTDDRNPDKMIDLFESQKQRVEQDINRLTQIKDMMEMQVESAKLSKNVQLGTIQVEYLEAEPIFLGELWKSQSDEKVSLSKMITKFYQYATSKGYCTFPWGVYLDIKKLNELGYDQAAQFYYRVPKSDSYKPAGNYIVAYILGTFEGRDEIYYKIYDYAKTNGYKLKSHLYEDYLLNEISTKLPEDYILRVSVPIE